LECLETRPRCRGTVCSRGVCSRRTRHVQLALVAPGAGIMHETVADLAVPASAWELQQWELQQWDRSTEVGATSCSGFTAVSTLCGGGCGAFWGSCGVFWVPSKRQLTVTLDARRIVRISVSGCCCGFQPRVIMQVLTRQATAVV